MATPEQSELVVVGRISGLYGVRGWIKIYSHTEPRENILSYSPWYLQRKGQWERWEPVQGKRHGKAVIAQLSGCDDRDLAAQLLDSTIAIQRDQLPQSAEGEYYWAELIGLQVRTVEGVNLGRVDHLLETGANDVLVVVGDRERLIPFVEGQYVKQVDLEQGTLLVDWDPEF